MSFNFIEGLSHTHGLVIKSFLTLCNPMDCSPPGSSVYGVLQVKLLEWGAISFSGDLPDLEIEPRSPTLQVDSLPTESQACSLSKDTSITWRKGRRQAEKWGAGLGLEETEQQGSFPAAFLTTLGLTIHSEGGWGKA